MLLRIGAVAVLMLLASAVASSAQPKIGLGASVSVTAPRDSALGDRVITVAPLIRVAPRKGFGLSWGLSWFETRVDLQRLGGPPAEGEIHIRPLMVGASYTFGGGNTFVSVSTVGGYAINTLKIVDETRRGSGEMSIEHSRVVRPGVSLWQSLHPRFGLSFFGGYVIVRPTVKTDGIFGPSERRLKADYATFSAGAAVLF